jgi:hypothetical protein
MSELLNRIDMNFEFVSDKLAAHTITDAGCWEYQGYKCPMGYGKFRIDKRTYRAHRVSYAYHAGIEPGELLVCHKCDNPCCINPDHLFLGTDKDNARDKAMKGRCAPQNGEHNPRALINKPLVLDIVYRIQAGHTNKRIAESLPISHSQVSMIRLGKSWREVTREAGYNPDDHRVFRRKVAA